jgi:hypothetical protein
LQRLQKLVTKTPLPTANSKIASSNWSCLIFREPTATAVGEVCGGGSANMKYSDYGEIGRRLVPRPKINRPTAQRPDPRKRNPCIGEYKPKLKSTSTYPHCREKSLRIPLVQYYYPLLDDQRLKDRGPQIITKEQNGGTRESEEFSRNSKWLVDEFFQLFNSIPYLLPGPC